MFRFRVQDPIDLELTEVAQDSFIDGSISKNGSKEQLNDESNMFLYGTDGSANRDEDNHFNEENVIDILANVDNEVMCMEDKEHMVSHQEDSLTKTIAGVAGNVLEW